MIEIITKYNTDELLRNPSKYIQDEEEILVLRIYSNKEEYLFFVGSETHDRKHQFYISVETSNEILENEYFDNGIDLFETFHNLVLKYR